MTIIFMIYVLAALIAPLIRLIGRHNYKIEKISKKVDSDLYWGSLLTLINEGFSVVSICFLIHTLNQFSFETYGLSVQTAFCILFGGMILLGLPLIFLIIVALNWDYTSEKTMKEKFGHLYQDLNLKLGRWTLIWPIFFLARRMALSIAIVMLDKLIWQMMILVGQIIFSLVIISFLEAL